MGQVGKNRLTDFKSPAIEKINTCGLKRSNNELIM